MRNGTLIDKKFALKLLDIDKKMIVERTRQKIDEDKIAKIL
jgi:hypothetical protein